MEGKHGAGVAKSKLLPDWETKKEGEGAKQKGKFIS